MSPEEAWIMVDMMKDVVQHGTAYASVWNAGFHLPAGAKTGTTNDGNDVWFVGYTADLVAGVWMGMDRPVKIMHDAQGGRLAAPAWTAFMTEVYRRKPAPPDWPRPPGLVSDDVDRTTGLLRNAYCPRSVVYTEWYIPGTEPVQICDVHSASDTSVGDTLNMQRMPTASAAPSGAAAPAVAAAPSSVAEPPAGITTTPAARSGTSASAASAVAGAGTAAGPYRSPPVPAPTATAAGATPVRVPAAHPPVTPPPRSTGRP
jgi:penicillin-binding protein 1A